MHTVVGSRLLQQCTGDMPVLTTVSPCELMDEKERKKGEEISAQ